MQTTVKKSSNVVLWTILIIMVSGFARDERKVQNKVNVNRILMVGVVYKPKKCGTETVSSSFDDIYVHKSATSCINGDYATVEKELKATISNQHNVEKNKILIYSSRKPFGVVISYEKKMSGWNCSVKRYSVGFGDTPLDAEKDAEKNKNMHESKGGYQKVETFGCN